MFGKKNKDQDRAATEAKRADKDAGGDGKRAKRKSDKWSDAEKVTVMTSGI
ncbi:hypothetical protein [Streptomyces sp. NPDC048644]|uniref:hypothetical protein n=1 Tax=Streptomyces sp. NPDC048644 TaxID=3365582 RepID=UPI00371BC674